MNLEMTPKQVADLGKIWGNAFLSSLSVEELLEHYDRQKILSQFKPQERLAGLEPQDILSQLKPQELDKLQEYLKKREQKN